MNALNLSGAATGPEARQQQAGGTARPDRTRGTRFPFTSFPTSWFKVACSDELVPGAVRPLRCFGRDLVLFRTAEGTPHVLDAHCPHLGAHLGHGGVVRNGTIECPFHGWRFDGGGSCTATPYSSRIPRRATVRSWPVQEVNGVIFVFHDLLGRAPDWSMPEWPEVRSDAWTRFHRGPSWRIYTHVQELGENGMDSAHFSFLHPQQTVAMETAGVVSDGPFFSHRTVQRYRVFPLAKLLVSEVTGPLDINLYGLGCAVNRTQVDAKIELHYAFAFFLTPIDEYYVEVSTMLAMRRLRSRLITCLLIKKALQEGKRTIDQDVPIWENKIYRDMPPLCQGDGPIAQYRRWARQFYPSEQAPS